MTLSKIGLHAYGQHVTFDELQGQSVIHIHLHLGGGTPAPPQGSAAPAVVVPPVAADVAPKWRRVLPPVGGVALAAVVAFGVNSALHAPAPAQGLPQQLAQRQGLAGPMVTDSQDQAALAKLTTQLQQRPAVSMPGASPPPTGPASAAAKPSNPFGLEN